MNNPNTIAIIGDWHSNTAWAIKALNRTLNKGIKVILHVGDFGIWPNGDKFLNTVNNMLEDKDANIYITLGNHEDYTQVRSNFTEPSSLEGHTHNPDYSRIHIAKRGARWNWNGTSFLSVGGANSIDRFQRVEWISWWNDEQISTADIYNSTENGHADIMITHDAPAGINLELGASTWKPEELEYAQHSRTALRAITDTVKPELLFHGHYHKKLEKVTTLNDGIENYTIQSISIDKDHSSNNVLFLDIETRKITWIM